MAENRRRLALAINLGVACGAVAAAAVISRSSDWEPLSLVIALGSFAVVSELFSVRAHRPVEPPAPETTWVFSASAPYVLAVVLLGAAPAYAIAVIALSVTTFRTRTPWRDWIANLANYGAFLVPLGLFADWAITEWDLASGNAWLPLLVVSIYACCVVCSFVFNGLYGALAYGESIREVGQREWRMLVAETPIAVSTGLTAYVYGTSGLGALTVLVTLQLMFMLLTRELGRSYEREWLMEQKSRHISELSASRGRLLDQVLAAEETERRRLAEALHDDAMQNLLSARQDLDEQDGRVDTKRIRRALDATIDGLREAISELHPAVLEQTGLAAAIQALADRHGRHGCFQVELDVQPTARSGHDPLLFTVARELLSNAAEHAEASQVKVELRRTAEVTLLRVTDDGKGFEASDLPTALERGHIGLASTAERVEALGGKLKIESSPAGGAAIEVSVPHASAEEPPPVEELADPPAHPVPRVTPVAT